MSWNHRIIEHCDGEITWYGIHEIYYEKDIPVSWTDPVDITSGTPEGLTFKIQGFIRAFYHPILKIDSDVLIDTGKILWPIMKEK